MDKNEILTERRAVRLGERQDEIMRYLARVLYDAGERTRRILPEVADVQAHPLPALQDLSTAVSEPRTLGDICDELAAYLADETRLAVAGRMRGLDEILTYFAASLAPTLRDLLTAKIQTCQTLGNAAAKAKLEAAAATLPDFATPADLEAHIVTGVRATEKLVAAWRNGKPCAFPAPDKFRIALRRALLLDAEGTRIANGMADGKTEALDAISNGIDFLVRDRKRRMAKNQRLGRKSQAESANEESDRAARDMKTALLRVRDRISHGETNVMQVCRAVCKRFTPLTPRKTDAGKFAAYAPLMGANGEPIKPETLAKNYRARYGTKRQRKANADANKARTAAARDAKARRGK